MKGSQIEALESERDEALAQVAALRQVLEQCRELLGDLFSTSDLEESEHTLDDRVTEALSDTATAAAQHDAQIRAKALEEFADTLQETWGQAYPNEGTLADLPCGEGGVSDEARSRISASMGRHVVASIINQALERAIEIRKGARP